MAVNTSTHPKLLWPGLHEIFHDGMSAEWKQQYDKVFDVADSDQHYEEVQGVISYGMAPVKSEGAPLIYDNENQGYNKRFTHVAYALGTQVTKEENDDNLYVKVGGSRVKMLARSMRETVETVCFNHLNRAESSSYVGWDGVELLSSVHPFVTGGTYANELATPADLSEAAVEDLLILMMKAKNDRGLREQLRPQCLIVTPDNAFNASRILNSQLQNDTANNAVNVLRDEGWFPKGIIVSSYLTDTDAWYVKTDAMQGGYFFWRQRPEMEDDVDFATKNLLFSGYMRFSSGWANPKFIYGSGGAA